MTVHTCADCSTPYALDLAACPHCSSTSVETDMGPARRLPLFVTVRCACGRGPWTVRLNSLLSGLIELPTLACFACGRRVSFTWPPEEEPMSPKITVHGGATNARETDDSPAVVVSQPQVVAEDDLGRPTPTEPVAAEPEANNAPEPEPELNADYDSMTLAELREAASARSIPSYGTKAQIVERLQEDAAA